MCPNFLIKGSIDLSIRRLQATIILDKMNMWREVSVFLFLLYQSKRLEGHYRETKHYRRETIIVAKQWMIIGWGLGIKEDKWL